MSTKKVKPLTPSSVCQHLKDELRLNNVSVKIQTASTTSLYLRLDRGILGSIRIGDHSGRRKYQYTYEIGSHIQSYAEIPQGTGDFSYIQYCFPIDQWKELVSQIRVDRASKIAKLSLERYHDLVHSALY